MRRRAEFRGGGPSIRPCPSADPASASALTASRTRSGTFGRRDGVENRVTHVGGQAIVCVRLREDVATNLFSGQLPNPSATAESLLRSLRCIPCVRSACHQPPRSPDIWPTSSNPPPPPPHSLFPLCKLCNLSPPSHPWWHAVWGRTGARAGSEVWATHRARRAGTGGLPPRVVPGCPAIAGWWSTETKGLSLWQSSRRSVSCLGAPSRGFPCGAGGPRCRAPRSELPRLTWIAWQRAVAVNAHADTVDVPRRRWGLSWCVTQHGMRPSPSMICSTRRRGDDRRTLRIDCRVSRCTDHRRVARAALLLDVSSW